MQGPDLNNRDINDLNNHIPVNYEDIFGEPDGIRSLDCVWTNSFKCFECWKSLCYKIYTLLCGVFLAAVWGCEFAAITFYHVWCWAPCMRDLSITAGCFTKFLETILGCCCTPICESCGSILSRIKISRG